MTERKWTPGPWFVTPDENDGEMCFVSKKSKETPFPRNWIACCCTGIDDQEWQSNAHLIAAAPDLYDALEGMLRLADAANASDRIICHQARAAIAKAQGDTV